MSPIANTLDARVSEPSWVGVGVKFVGAIFAVIITLTNRMNKDIDVATMPAPDGNTLVICDINGK